MKCVLIWGVLYINESPPWIENANPCWVVSASVYTPHQTHLPIEHSGPLHCMERHPLFVRRVEQSCLSPVPGGRRVVFVTVHLTHMQGRWGWHIVAVQAVTCRWRDRGEVYHSTPTTPHYHLAFAPALRQDWYCTSPAQPTGVCPRPTALSTLLGLARLRKKRRSNMDFW